MTSSTSPNFYHREAEELVTGNDNERTTLESFSTNVEIGREQLPYVLEGEIPEQPASFELVVRLPDDEWKKLEPNFCKRYDEDKHFAQWYRTSHEPLRLGEGRVGSVWVGKALTEDNAPSIGIRRIQTKNSYLPENNRYYEADGIGSFLLDTLGSIADEKGWRIYLEPVERGGGNKPWGFSLYDWYQRHGFTDDFDRRMSARGAGGMMRLPKPPRSE